MKLSTTFFLTSLAMASATSPLPIYGNLKQGKTKSMTGEITADSILGSKLLSKARQLEENNADYSWVTGMSVKFQGCFHVSQWNNDADNENDVKIMTKRFVRFRLCPTDTCSASKAGGCDSGYGDYIIDMYDFTETFLQAKRQVEEQACKNLEKNGVCACEDNGDDAFDEEVCIQDCYAALGMSYCYREEGAFEPNKYLECKEFEVPEGDDRGRRLEEEEEVKYYIGPYCGNQGGDVYFGMFTDNTCSQFVDNNAGKTTYETLVGSSLPYSSKSLIGSDCVTCMKANEQNNNNKNEEEEAKVTEMCETFYKYSGKCESGLNIDNPHNNACSFMEGIKIIRKNGLVSVTKPAASKTTGTFIGLFAVSTVLLGCYSYYLKTRLSRKIDLAALADS